MKTIILYIFTFVFINTFNIFSQDNIILQTNYGNIEISLCEETPMHKENIIDLVNSGFYDGLLFHRVIKDFMIQTGDPNSKGAEKGERLGSGGSDYTIPAEFHPSHYHKKGAVCAARQGDQINPSKSSSSSQFYIVHGRIFSHKELDYMEQNNLHIKFTPEQRRIYTTIGGSPHLDYSYTVFGYVINGIDVVEKISSVSTDKFDRPLKDVKIIKAIIK